MSLSTNTDHLSYRRPQITAQAALKREESTEAGTGFGSDGKRAESYKNSHMKLTHFLPLQL